MCCYLAVNAQLLSRCSLLQSSSSAQSLAQGPTSMKLEHFNTPPPLAGAGLTVAIILPAFQQRVHLSRSSRRTECSVDWPSIIATAPHQCVDVMTIAFCEIRAILINFQPSIIMRSSSDSTVHVISSKAKGKFSRLLHNCKFIFTFQWMFLEIVNLIWIRTKLTESLDTST